MFDVSKNLICDPAADCRTRLLVSRCAGPNNIHLRSVCRNAKVW